MAPATTPLTASAVDRMKRDAKKLRKAEGIPHHVALDRVAAQHGFQRWSLLAQAAAAAEKGGQH